MNRSLSEAGGIGGEFSVFCFDAKETAQMAFEAIGYTREMTLSLTFAVFVQRM